MDVLLNYDYPGNVRELQNIIEHALIVCQEKIVERIHLPLSLQQNISPQQPGSDLYAGIDQTGIGEKHIIISLLRKNNWNKGKTASALNINRTTLWRKIKKYNISP